MPNTKAKAPKMPVTGSKAKAKAAKPKPEPGPGPGPAPAPYPTLGAKILELIEARGLTVSAAAEMVGMTRQQLFRIIQGDPEKGGVPNPGVLTIQRAVRRLGGRMKDIWADGDLINPDRRKRKPGDEFWEDADF